MMHQHVVAGCAPAPLAHYLKALGVMRLITEQIDPAARGWWIEEQFHLASRLSRSELEDFFLNQYKPTGLVAPWNGGAGFYPKDKKGARAIAEILKSDAARFSPYKEAIKAASALVKGRTEAPKLQEKADLLAQCRRLWRGGHLTALEAAISIDADGKPAYPSLLGTGLNDGRFDFTSNFMERVIELLLHAPEKARTQLLNALWNSVEPGVTSDAAIGQFLPGSAGGANSGNGPLGDPQLNGWDFVLALEGAVLFTAHATRRLGAGQSARLATPFAVGGHGAGYASAAESDESARGEQWMPLWNQPTTFIELKRLFAEGRAQLGAHNARDPVELARAVASLGVSRGISAFQRYGYIERNGQANFAVPLGRFRTPERVAQQLTCLEDLDGYDWLKKLRRAARDVGAPGRLRVGERRLADAIFDAVQFPGQPRHWQAVLLALADIEAILKDSPSINCRPLHHLSIDWLHVADDGSPEFRMARACALQFAEAPFFGIRRHWLPEKNGDTAAVMEGRDGVTDAIALVERRLIEAAQHGIRRLPLGERRGSAANLADLAAFTTGTLDADRTLALARILSAVRERPKDAVAQKISRAEIQGAEWPDDAWLALRLCHLPWPPTATLRQIPVDPAILRRLASGDVSTAVTMALRRLQAAGLTIGLRAATADVRTARLWAAALAFPISKKTAADIVRYLDPTQNKKLKSFETTKEKK